MENNQFKVSALHYIGPNNNYVKIKKYSLNTITDMDKQAFVIFKKLREANKQFSLMKCKQAIEEALNQITDISKEQEIYDKAYEIANALTNSDPRTIKSRTVKEGYIVSDISDDTKAYTLLALGCESEQLAAPKEGNNAFIELADAIADIAIRNSVTSLFGLLDSDFDEGRTVLDAIDDTSLEVNENILIMDFKKLVKEVENPENYVFKVYPHHNHKIYSVGLFKSTKNNQESLREKVLQHIAFTNPLALKLEDIPNAVKKSIAEAAKAKAILDDIKKHKEWAALQDETKVLKKIAKEAVEELSLLTQQMTTDQDFNGTVQDYLKQNNIELIGFEHIKI